MKVTEEAFREIEGVIRKHGIINYVLAGATDTDIVKITELEDIAQLLGIVEMLKINITKEYEATLASNEGYESKIDALIRVLAEKEERKEVLT